MNIHRRPYYLTIIDGTHTSTFHFSEEAPLRATFVVLERKHPHATFVSNLNLESSTSDREWYPV